MTPFLEPLQVDLLRAAFLRSDEAVPAWQRWRASIDWDDHIDAEAFALLPAVYRNLQRLGVDDALFPRFKGIARQSWLHNQHLIADLGATLTSCEDAQIEVLVLPPLGLYLHDATAVLGSAQPLRWVVARENAEKTIRCLHAAGWRNREIRLPAALVAGYVRGARHLLLEDGNDRWLTLTWSLTDFFEDRAEVVWRRTQPAALGRHQVRALDATDTLELLVRQPPAGTWLRRIGEVLSIQSTAAGIDWRRLQSELRTCPLPSSWAEALRFMQPFLVTGADRVVDLHDSCGERRSASITRQLPANWLERARQDWTVYRHCGSDEVRPYAALLQLPGYLMGRWHLARPTQLPGGVYRWMRYGKRTRT